MYNATTFDTFAAALRTAAYHSAQINTNTSEPGTYEHGRHEFYLSEDGLSGFAVSHTGELVGVFSRVKGRGPELMKHAIYRGATHLDCFEGYLSAFYARHGFVEVGSERNWGGDHLPRVVYMALGSAVAALQSRGLSYHEDEVSLLFADLADA